MKAVRIFLVEDHEIVRQGLRTLLGGFPGWEVCGEAGSAGEAVEKVRVLSPDVVVMDISLPDYSGIDAIGEILGIAPKTLVLVLSMHEASQFVRDALRAGARGYVFKSDPGRDIVRAIQSIVEGTTFLSSGVCSLVLTEFVSDQRAASRPAERDILTARERSILRLLAEGRANKEVAARLGISVRTVETHRSRIMSKLRVRSVGELVRYAVRNNLVAP